jgi:hypothetical protein
VWREDEIGGHTVAKGVWSMLVEKREKGEYFMATQKSSRGRTGAPS